MTLASILARATDRHSAKTLSHLELVLSRDTDDCGAPFSMCRDIDVFGCIQKCTRTSRRSGAFRIEAVKWYTMQLVCKVQAPEQGRRIDVPFTQFLLDKAGTASTNENLHPIHIVGQ